MKIILQTLLRYKSATLLNIIGLSTAFAAFIFISTQIRYDFMYDKHNENYESVYMVSCRDTISGATNYSFARNIAIELKNDVSEVEYASIKGTRYNDRVTIVGDDHTENQNIIGYIHTCEEDLPKIFTFNWLEGDPNALADPTNIVISDAFSKRWYGDSSPIGRTLINDGTSYTITAVYKSFPKNSTLHGNLYCNVGKENWNNDNNHNYNLFAKVHNNVDKQKIDESLFTFIFGDGLPDDFPYISDAIPLKDIRYDYYGYSRNITLLLLSIVLAVILLASINFVNFATSMVPLKIKGINIRKVVGATQTQLRASIVGEALTLVVLSFIIALGLVELFKASSLNNILQDSSFEVNIPVYLITLGIALGAGVVSSLYPAIYSTSFQPALVLKSSYALSASGRNFRKLLICFQFFVTLSFIAGALFIHLQHNYMMERDGGYIKEDIIHVDHGITYNKHNTLKLELLKSPLVKDVTFANDAFGIKTGVMSWGRSSSKGRIQITSLPVAHNFLDFFGIDIIEGRNFIESDEESENGRFIMSKMFMDETELPMDEKINGHREATDIVGVCENVNLTNLKIKLEPFTFYIYGKHPWGYLGHSYIKVSGDSDQIMNHIRDCYKKTSPDITIETNYMTTELENAYDEESKMKSIMQSLSLIAIIIALVGVFGLVSFDTRYRCKEIGLRRINGATVGNILRMFSMSYIKILLVSFCLSVPAVYYIIDKWLVNFPYRIDIHWWVFALALLMVLALTVVVSVTQTLRAACENPVNAIKSN